MYNIQGDMSKYISVSTYRQTVIQVGTQVVGLPRREVGEHYNCIITSYSAIVVGLGNQVAQLETRGHKKCYYNHVNHNLRGCLGIHGKQLTHIQ